jgi:hypothetical protein
MAKKKVITPEEARQISIDSAIADLKRMIALGAMPLNPTRTFAVDERIVWGAHEEVYVRAIHEGGLYYTIESIGHDKEGKLTGFSSWNAMPWMNIFKYNTIRDTDFTLDEKYFIRQLNSGLDSLLHMVYSGWGGVDFDVEYQREHVWKLVDKVSLIDSIFNNIEIGKFVFVQKHGSTMGKYYEVIDGKQRLTAICEFYEDRYQYKGKYFSELSNKDRWKFLNYSVSYGYLETPSKEAIYSTFIKMNTCGKPMDSKHLDKVKELLKELQK